MDHLGPTRYHTMAQNDANALHRRYYDITVP
mgnify:CR=1 FL=1